MPSVESKKYLDEAKSVRNHANQRGRLITKATRYLRFNERDKRATEAKRIKDMLTPTNIQIAKMGEMSVGQARTHLNALEEDLEIHSPPDDLSGACRDDIAKELAREEDTYRTGLLSREEMRRNEVGALDRHLRHERAVIDGMSNKDRAFYIKNLRVLLNPNSDEQDLANLENLRPSTYRLDGAPQFSSSAQIGGVFAMTPQAKDNWPEKMPEYGEVDSPWAQAMRRENEALKAQLEGVQAHLKKNNSHLPKTNYVPWTCDHIDAHKGLCGKTVPTYQKGVHKAQHGRMDRAIKRAEIELAKVRVANAAREEEERNAKPGDPE